MKLNEENSNQRCLIVSGLSNWINDDEIFEERMEFGGKES